MLQQCNVVNLSLFANGCVWNYTQVEIGLHGMRITLVIRIPCKPISVHIQTVHIFRILTRSLFSRSTRIPPSWRCVFPSSLRHVTNV